MWQMIEDDAVVKEGESIYIPVESRPDNLRLDPSMREETPPESRL